MGTPTSPYVTPGNRRRSNTGSTNTSGGSRPAGTSYGTGSQPWYMDPNANARPDTQYWWADQLDPNRLNRPSQNATLQRDFFNAGIPYDQRGVMPYGVNQPQFPGSRAGGGGGGYGGGGGGGGGGIDQGTLDWIMARLSAQPGMVTYRPLDLPDPSQYMRWDPSMYDQAGQGVNQGIEAMRQRGNAAFDTAVGEVGRYQNPYAGGLQTRNPDQRAQMAAMARANDATSALQGVAGEGVQADRAFGNVAALMAANDQARQAANLRAIGADRRMMDQNLGLEGNLLNLGVNMAKARGKTAFDQQLQQAMLTAAQQEAMQNYTRGNEVESTNVGARNQWMQDTLGQIMNLIGAMGAGVKLPGDMSWFQAMGPGVDVSGGFNQPRPA